MALAIHRSSKLIPAFVLHRPESPEEALAVARTHGGTAAFMAGGISLINALKTGTQVERVIHLGRLPGFDALSVKDGRLHIGAGVTLWRLQHSPEIDVLDPAVRHALAQVGNVRVRLQGTVGGNIMAGDPNYDIAPIMMALGAELVFATSDGSSSLPIAETSRADRQPALLLGISVPAERNTWFAYDRTMRPVVTLAIGIDVRDGCVTAARVGLACAYRQALCAPVMLPPRLEPQAMARVARDVAESWAETLPEPVTGIGMTAAYRRRIAAVLLRRHLTSFAARFAAA